MDAHHGPANIAARIAGAQHAVRKTNNAPYFTNNERIPWPDATPHNPRMLGEYLLSMIRSFWRSSKPSILEKHLKVWHPCLINYYLDAMFIGV